VLNLNCTNNHTLRLLTARHFQVLNLNCTNNHTLRLLTARHFQSEKMHH